MISPYFMFLVFICAFLGIIFSLINNDLYAYPISQNSELNKDNINYLYNKNKSNLLKENEIIKKIDVQIEKAEEILNQIKEREKELKEKEKERKKLAEKLIKEIEEKRKEENKKKEEEEKKKKEEEKKKKEEEEKKKKEEEKKTKEKEEKNKINKENKQKNKDENLINQIDDEINSENNIPVDKSNKLIIACAYATDNAYVYPTLVAMTSLAENAGKNTFYDIYVMINPEFTAENKKVLKSVQIKHPEHCEVIFLDMGSKFKDEKTNQKITTPTYYRLELHNLLPNVHRIIWMDGDTAVFEDLTELITIDMKDNYIMGFLDSIPEAIERFNIKNATVLCAGVLLMDLDALRKNNMGEKFAKFMKEEKEKINQHDQTIVNVVCQGHIAPLPPKYGIWCFEAEKYALKHNERQRPHLRYNKDEFLKAYYHPAILHYVWPKPFWKRKKPIFNNEWWNYAKISGYYNEVYNKSPKYVARLLSQKLDMARYIYYYK